MIRNTRDCISNARFVYNHGNVITRPVPAAGFCPKEDIDEVA